jgi:putative transcriptional regulator
MQISESFRSITQGLTEAIEFAQGQTTGAIVHEFAPLDIKAVRAKACNGLRLAKFFEVPME